jgi:hypothetical protein
VKTTKRLTRRPTVKAVSRKKIVRSLPAEEISREDVAVLEQEASLQKRSEKAWLSMTSVSPEEGDGWSAVEEHLLSKDQGKNHSLRRWKYFAK